MAGASRAPSSFTTIRERPATSATTELGFTKGGYSNPLNGSNSISVYHQYDSLRESNSDTDARGIQTQIVYGDINGFTGLYPTEARTAYQTSVQRTRGTEYDFYTAGHAQLPMSIIIFRRPPATTFLAERHWFEPPKVNPKRPARLQIFGHACDGSSCVRI